MLLFREEATAHPLEVEPWPHGNHSSTLPILHAQSQLAHRISLVHCPLRRLVFSTIGTHLPVEEYTEWGFRMPADMVRNFLQSSDSDDDAVSAPREERHLRADARRNRVRVMEAAREVFSERGPEARMEEVAQRAGVGVGTLYRNFPDKETLIAELIAESMQQMTSAAREALDAEDTWEAFEGVVRSMVGTMSKNRAFAGALPWAEEEKYLSEVREELVGVMERLMGRVQQAGMLRSDVVHEELMVLLFGLVQAAPHLTSSNGQERCVSVVLDGLRL